MAGARMTACPSRPPPRSTIADGTNQKEERRTTLPWFQGGGPSLARRNELTIESPIREVGAKTIWPFQGAQGDLSRRLSPRAPPSLDPSQRLSRIPAHSISRNDGTWNELS